MEENLNETQTPKVDGNFRSRLENFWYHYKWHSIVSVFVVFIVVICSLQMCKKEDYDLYVLYGGSKKISTQMENGVRETDVITSSIKQITKDYDDNGEIKPIFYSIYLLSDDEIKAAGDSVNHSEISKNNQEFRDLMYSSSYYICFLSKDLYLEYAQTAGVFCPIKNYTGGADLDYVDDYAVYLHSKNLPFNQLPGICDLPEDTVICLKAKTAFSASFTKGDKKQFERSEESLRAIFSFGR